MMFYKENTFQSTSIGKIPKDWKVARLTEVADYINGYAFSPKDWKTEGLPIIRIQNLNDPAAEFNYFDGRIDERYFVKNGDLLFAWSASIGCYLWNRGDAWLNQHIFKVVPKQGVNREYLYYVLFKAIEQLKRRVHGSTMKHFRRRELKTTFIPLPPLLEQRAIVGVLGVVDSAIELVDKVIAKTERLKKGLMQTLLTRGIGHKEYKQTPIGKIPKTWDVVRLKEVVLDIKDTEHKIPKKVKCGVPFVSINYMIKFPDHNFFINEKDPNIEFISKEEFLYHQKRFDVEYGDILFSKWGTIAQAKFVNTKKKFIASCAIALIKTDKKIVNPLFLTYVLNSQQTKRQLWAVSKTSTRTEFHIGHIKKLKIPVPHLAEQQNIVKILRTIDEKLQLERIGKARLERIKRGLMDLLLTGKIRVKVS